MSALGPSDDAEFERLRRAARERLEAIKAERARQHEEEMASARRPSAVDAQRTAEHTTTK